jgi:hypothetical protein
MSAQDRHAERLVADFYNESVRPPANPEPLAPRAKRFGEGVLIGLAISSVLGKLFR